MRGAGNSPVPKPPLLLPGIHPPQQRLFHKEQCPETITALEGAENKLLSLYLHRGTFNEDVRRKERNNVLLAVWLGKC